jgi:hypothetical protein
MPYAEPLRDVPQVPDPGGPYVKGSGHPTQQLFDCLQAMQKCLETFKAALDEIEPPDAMESVTVAGLPSAAASAGKRYRVTNATATTFHSIVAATGANIVPVFSDGTNWRIG